MNENISILSFPKEISKVIKNRYEDLICHKIFVEERLETLNLHHKEKDIFKYTIHKGYIAKGDLREKLNMFVELPNNENWEAIKNLKIIGKKTAEEVWLEYVKFNTSINSIGREAFLFAIKFGFDNEVKGYRSRLNDTLKQLEKIKEMHPNIDNEVNLDF